jgi:glutamate-5-semialdehyde dehydrogenase
MNKQLAKQLQLAKQASVQITKLSAKQKKAVLLAIVKNLEKHKQEIFAANEKDVLVTKEKGATNAFVDRLTLSEKGFVGMLLQLETVAKLHDTTGEVIEERILANGIHLKKIRFPLGVIAMIYESRPNVTVDVAGLCFKSGNAVVLKGGKEAAHTNRVLVRCIQEVLATFGIAKEVVTFLDNATHEDVSEMLKRNDLIDVVIPRGSYGLTTAIARESRIPILYHASGGARMYVDASADIAQALEICVNAKTNRTGVCNALDMVLVHKKIAKEFVIKLAEQLVQKNFQLRLDKQSYNVISTKLSLGKISSGSLARVRDDKLIIFAAEEDFSTEFLDSILAVKMVDTAQEALSFIQTHTHGHTEILAAKDTKIIDAFIHEIDAAGLMINCSSRLHDGGEFGMGAEMGIATGKFHARGPVGIRELTTYKWIAYGNGQVKQ